MRLIDADAMLNEVSLESIFIPCGQEFTELALRQWINKQPTAYDVSKVVEELEEEYVDCQKNMNLVKDEDGNEAGHIYDEYLNKSIAYETAINIVKQKIDNGL